MKKTKEERSEFNYRNLMNDLTNNTALEDELREKELRAFSRMFVGKLHRCIEVLSNCSNQEVIFNTVTALGETCKWSANHIPGECICAISENKSIGANLPKDIDSDIGF